MNFTEYEQAAMRTANAPSSRDLVNAALGLAGEAGEFADAVKKAEFQGHAIDKAALSKEVGDILWYCALACRALGTDLETVAGQNIEKLRRRYPAGFSVEASLAREDEVKS